MKFRADFVTNSSSSSFIFQRKYSIEDIRRLRLKLLKEANIDSDSLEYENLNYEFDCIAEDIKTIDQFSPKVLAEVVSWYQEEFISRLIDGTPPDQSETHTLSDEKLRILAGIWYFEYIDLKYCVLGNECLSPTYELLKEYVWDYLTYAHQYDDGLLATLITDNGERFLTSLTDMAKMPLPEIFEMVTGGKYMHYDDLETYWLVSDTFQEDENCLFGCNHMG